MPCRPLHSAPRTARSTVDNNCEHLRQVSVFLQSIFDHFPPPSLFQSYARTRHSCKRNRNDHGSTARRAHNHRRRPDPYDDHHHHRRTVQWNRNDQHNTRAASGKCNRTYAIGISDRTAVQPPPTPPPCSSRSGLRSATPKAKSDHSNPER